MGAVTLVRMNPHVIRYPNEVVQQMGPGTFFYRLGLIGPRAAGLRRSRGSGALLDHAQFGRTSLLVYWIHVDLCYGIVSGRLHHALDMRRRRSASCS